MRSTPNGRVACAFGEPVYCREAPFHPGQAYPELISREVCRGLNPAYHLLRELFVSLNLDPANQGSPKWNPFGELIQPGETVVIKPNFVGHRNASGQDLFAMITHPSVIRAVIDYSYIALRGQGRIVVADSPEMYCNWSELMRATELPVLQEFYWEKFRFEIKILDLRNFEVIEPQNAQVTGNRRPLPGDPAGSVLVNLGDRSHFAGLASENYYGADYDRAATVAHHHGTIHRYVISKTVLSADVVICIPKMKTHKKVGVTLNLKGLVGIVTDKNCLIHYRLGTPKTLGDQLPDGQPVVDQWLIRLQRWLYDRTLAHQSSLGDNLYKAAGVCYRNTLGRICRLHPSTVAHDGGNWHGNDSAWRMVADLAKVIHYADEGGHLNKQAKRRTFSVVDGMIAGEGNGPLRPEAKACGCMVAGNSLFAVDFVTTGLMGFDPSKLHQFDVARDGGWDFGETSPDRIRVLCCQASFTGEEFLSGRSGPQRFRFVAPPGWGGIIEQGSMPGR